MKDVNKTAFITKKISLGKRQYEYDLDIEAEVERSVNSDMGTRYNISDYDIQIMRGSRIVKEKRAEVIKKRFYQEYRMCLDDINNLLIENAFY